MFSSHQTSIEEFITSSIPICQHGCALETILNASQSSKDGSVAIVNRQQFPLGIVTAHRLLSLFVDHQYNRRIPTSIGSQKQLDPRAALMATTNLKSVLQPVKVLHSRITIAEFLSGSSDRLFCRDRSEFSRGDTRESCSKEPASVEQRTSKYASQELRENNAAVERDLDWQKFGYAIVDDRKKFLGMLDISKLSEYLFWKTDYSLATATETSLPRFELIDNIRLPLTLLGSEDNILYQNHLWQQNFNVVSEQLIDCSSQIARWWIGQQKIEHEAQFAPNQNQREVSTFFPNLKVGTKVTAKNMPDWADCLFNSPIFAASELQISFLNDWYYVKIPLHFAEAKITNSAEPYWLVLAIEGKTEPNLRDIWQKADWCRLHELFLANISHELKSPLTGIIGLSSLLKAEKLGNLNPRQSHYAELIYRSGKQSLDIVNDLLKLTELNTSKQNFTIEPIALETLCRQTYRQTSTELEVRDNFELLSSPQLELSIAPNSQTVFVDRSFLTQIVSRSLEWAIKTQPERIGITVNSWTGWLSIVVWNQISIGESPQIPLTSRELVGDDSQSELSLLFARQLAKAHGGDASAIFRANGRNEFTLLLPQNTEDDCLQANYKDLQIVVILETQLHRLSKIASAIQELGYHSVVARTGIEALQQARQLQPSYILMNPDSSLLESKDLLTLLKSDRQTQNIPIFLLTTVLNKPTDSQTFRQVQGLICEPFNRDTLARVLPAKHCTSPNVSKNITILCIYPEPEAIDESLRSKNANFSLKYWSERDWTTQLGDDSRQNVRYRIIEAEGLEQARTLARIWQLDAIVLDSAAIANPQAYLQSLQQFSELAALPLIILDSQTSEVANQIPDLNVYPCFLPAKINSIKDLMQVIQIATKTKF
ncbi:hybrid sensor histidine kinase/response regulator [Myxosarcina sp. GI1]|uniref:ATP-binding response regulator n=1 Tax=Myxosarcina sp. GI1 TaxID=1541065 RepID=UPI00055BE8A1|nr:hybrid sensor histidine kinase/response regulator [Myxosarcina sp. GI1]